MQFEDGFDFGKNEEDFGRSKDFCGIRVEPMMVDGMESCSLWKPEDVVELNRKPYVVHPALHSLL